MRGIRGFSIPVSATPLHVRHPYRPRIGSPRDCVAPACPEPSEYLALCMLWNALNAMFALQHGFIVHVARLRLPMNLTPMVLHCIAARVALCLLCPAPPRPAGFHIRSGAWPTLRPELWRALRACRRLIPPPTPRYEVCMLLVARRTRPPLAGFPSSC